MTTAILNTGLPTTPLRGQEGREPLPIFVFVRGNYLYQKSPSRPTSGSQCLELGLMVRATGKQRCWASTHLPEGSGMTTAASYDPNKGGSCYQGGRRNVQWINDIGLGVIQFLYLFFPWGVDGSLPSHLLPEPFSATQAPLGRVWCKESGQFIIPCGQLNSFQKHPEALSFTARSMFLGNFYIYSEPVFSPVKWE